MSENDPVRNDLNKEDQNSPVFSAASLRLKMIVGIILVLVLSGLSGFAVNRYTVSSQLSRIEAAEAERADNAARAVAEILDRELPEIRNRVKKIISGPVYKGVESIGKDSFKITLFTECREEDYRRVQRQVNREIRLLFDREGIPII